MVPFHIYPGGGVVAKHQFNDGGVYFGPSGLELDFCQTLLFSLYIPKIPEMISKRRVMLMFGH